MPRRLATCQMVSPCSASTSLPSSVNFTVLPLPFGFARDLVGGGGMRNAGLAGAEIFAARLAFIVVAVAGRLLPVRISHASPLFDQRLITSFPWVCSIHQGNISTRITADSAPPGQGRKSTHRASRSKVPPAASRPRDLWPSASLLFRCPHGMACIGRSSRLRRTASDSIATAFISSLSDRITTAWDPTKQPYFSSVPKSSGSSAIEAGSMPPEAPPGK